MLLLLSVEMFLLIVVLSAHLAVFIIVDFCDDCIWPCMAAEP